MNLIKKIIKEIFKTIGEAIWGFALGILVFTLILIALKEIVRVFTNVGFLQFAGIASIIVAILGLIDYIGDYDIFIEISDYIKSLFS